MLATNCLKLFALKLKIKVNTCQTKDEKKKQKNHFNDQTRFCYKCYEPFKCCYDDNDLHMILDNII